MAERPARPSFDEAIATVARHAPDPCPIETRLADALGCVTAGEILAKADYPRFDASAMDGFAFASSVSAGASESTPIILPIRGESRAGGMLPAGGEGAAYRISTGAPIPAGCDTVLAREFAVREGDSVRLTNSAQGGRNIRRRGEDATQGDRVLGIGRALTAEILGALACYGIDTVLIARRPKLAILSTGDELRASARSGDSHIVFDSNGLMIEAMAGAIGLVAHRWPAVADDIGELTSVLGRALGSDAQIIVSTGGVSAGDHDHLPSVVRAAGAVVHFHGVAMRPGKPVLFATLPNGALYFGLPGNPVAAALGFRFLVVAALRKMLGLGVEQGIPVSTDAEPRPETTLLLKARSDDQRRITILADQRSHTMRPLIDANCWVAIDRDEGGTARHRLYGMRPADIF